jgi:hypothetical protein
MSILGVVNKKDKRTLIMPTKGVLDFTVLSSKQGMKSLNLMVLSSKKRVKRRGLKSIIRKFLNR